jgi:hypothetical protein
MRGGCSQAGDHHASVAGLCPRIERDRPKGGLLSSSSMVKKRPSAILRWKPEKCHHPPIGSVNLGVTGNQPEGDCHLVPARYAERYG